ncbi:MAG: helix-turn-helix domain-containing protein [bacterium]
MAASTSQVDHPSTQVDRQPALPAGRPRRARTAHTSLALPADPSVGRPSPDRRAVSPARDLPRLLTAQEAADLLRTTRRALYAAIERGQVPGVLRLGRRVLFRRDELLDWLGLDGEERRSC